MMCGHLQPSTEIEIMIINIDAFKKAENIFNQDQDRLSGSSAIRLIQDTHPIVIIDEPQSVDNTPKAKESDPLAESPCVCCGIPQPHREKINLLYRLTSVDAFRLGLVKQISVFSSQVEGGHNQALRPAFVSLQRKRLPRKKSRWDVKEKNRHRKTENSYRQAG